MWQQCASWDTEFTEPPRCFSPPQTSRFVPNKTHQAWIPKTRKPCGKPNKAPWEIPIFPGTNHQNGGFSHGVLLFYRRFLSRIDRNPSGVMAIFMPKYQMVDIPERCHLQNFEISRCNSVDDPMNAFLVWDLECLHSSLWNPVSISWNIMIFWDTLQVS